MRSVKRLGKRYLNTGKSTFRTLNFGVDLSSSVGRVTPGARYTSSTSWPLLLVDPTIPHPCRDLTVESSELTTNLVQFCFSKKKFKTEEEKLFLTVLHWPHQAGSSSVPNTIIVPSEGNLAFSFQEPSDIFLKCSSEILANLRGF